MKFEYYIIGGMLFLVLGVLALIAVSPSDIPWPKPAEQLMPVPGETLVPEMIVEEMKEEPVERAQLQSVEEPELVVVKLEEKVSLAETPIEEPARREETEVELPVIMIAKESGVVGCEKTNECFIPYELKVSVGTEVTWDNQDIAAHTVTSGTASGGPDGIFDSSIFMAETSFSHKFDAAGEYNYFCMVHPWMKGIVIVE